MQVIERIYNTCGNMIEKFLIGFIGISAAVCLLVANIAVLTRYIFHYSLPWSEELLRLLFVVIVYTGTALAYKNDGLIGITMLEESLIGKARNIPYKCIKVAQHVIAIIFAGICFFQGMEMTRIQIMNNELTPAMQIPAAIATVGVVVGMIVWIYFAVGKIAKYILIKEIKKAEY